MEKQLTDTILMIEPVAFGFNEETAQNNFFQQQDDTPDRVIQQKALSEFSSMVHQLQNKGIQIIVVKDTIVPHTPDSIFPNNWISFHQSGNVVVYPMFAKNRRLERRSDIIQTVVDAGFKIADIIDYSDYENCNCFLEGTGSVVLDRKNRIAYAALSERTHKGLFERFCDEAGYKAVSFVANQTVGDLRLPVYHTNVVLCVAEEFVVVCFDCVDNPKEINILKTNFVNTGKEIISISEKQMHSFAGNMLQVMNSEGKKFLVMSQSASDALEVSQIESLRKYNEFIIAAVPTIEKYGGGSVRCMMAEVFKNIDQKK